MKKSYLALVKGCWQHGEVEVDFPLVRNRIGVRKKVEVNQKGKAARTRFSVVEHFGVLGTLMEIFIMNFDIYDYIYIIFKFARKLARIGTITD